MRKIHLLVPCTARKTLDVSTSMNISEHLSSDIQTTIENWERAFSGTTSKTKAEDLYSGQAFSKLRTYSKEHDFSLKILSAGFGLVDGTTELPGYNATFAQNNNRVPTPRNDWWNTVTQSSLPSTSIKDTVKSHPQDNFVIVASNEYLQAIQVDLLEALSSSESAHERFAIVTTSIPKTLSAYASCFVKCSRKVLQHQNAKAFGLSLADRSITTIATLMFLEKLALTKPDFSGTISALNNEFADLKEVQRPKKVSPSPEFIEHFIRREIDSVDRPASSTSMLRKFRNSGYACSAERFGEFYKQVKSEKGLS